jgi:hypothetical protein
MRIATRTGRRGVPGSFPTLAGDVRAQSSSEPRAGIRKRGKMLISCAECSLRVAILLGAAFVLQRLARLDRNASQKCWPCVHSKTYTPAVLDPPCCCSNCTSRRVAQTEL